MAGFDHALRLVRRLTQPKSDDLTDRDLLDRFAMSRDEVAFDAIVQRHGRMIHAVCRRLLHNHAHVDDAFQATFLVLVKKAGSLKWQQSVGSWLYEVACRVCKKANAREALRQTREREVSMTSEASTVENAGDAHVALHEELRGLPDKYRSPLVLCYFEGKTSEQAARELGVGTSAVKMRVARGRDKLRDRLARRGISLAPAALVALLSEQASAASLPLGLTTTTARAALLMATGKGLAGTNEIVPILVEGVVQDMFTRKLRRMALVGTVVALLATGFGLLSLPGGGSQALAGPPPLELKPVNKEDKLKVVEGNTRFTTDLYGQLRTQKGNLFFSPYSISTALAMTYAGARGQTEAGMQKVLHFDLPQEKLHTGFSELIADTNGNGKDRGYKLAVANRLWGQKNFNFRPDFLKITQDQYGAGLESVDFKGDAESARRTINNWVEKKTEDKIKDLLKPGVLKPVTRLVLTNAIYFKGDWQTQFDKKATTDQPFFLTKEDKKTVPLMRVKTHFGYHSDENVDVLEMPYKNKELSMVVYLPKKRDGLEELERNLSTERLTKLLPKGSAKVEVYLPRFKFTAEFMLKETLESMGMKQAFEEGTADFRGMRSKNDLFISNVIHKAFVDVNEEGTEAAAATAVIVDRKKSAVIRADPVFRADHPFLFVIKDNKTNSILFMGRVVDPSQG